MKTQPASPLYFGPQGQPLYGVWHPGAPAAASLAVVLCSAWGSEDLATHHLLKHLAERLAAMGLPVLRFDAQGCGDAAGELGEADGIAAWTASVHHAVDEARRRSGVPRVALLGLRLGAALAALAAVQRDDIAGLVALFPVSRGRAYLRELKALGASGAGQRLEAGGFELNAATQASLASLALDALPNAPAPQLLLVERDDLAGSPAWAEQLQRHGAAVQCERLPGWRGLMQDAHRSQRPEAVCERTLDWLAALAARLPATPATHAPAGLVMAQQAEADGLLERLVQVAVPAGVPAQAADDDAAAALLHGVCTVASHLPASGHAFLLLNAGAVRRVGPNRMSVELARRWARQGHLVLRIDLGGLGDSEPAQGGPVQQPYPGRGVADTRAALEWLRSQPGIRHCHVAGLCSGAYHGFKAAVLGAAVDTVLAINPTQFFPEASALPDYKVAGEMARYRASLWDRSRWRKLLRGQVDLRRLAWLLVRRAGSRAAAPWRELARGLGLPLRRDLAAELELLARRGVRLRALFSGSDCGEELLLRQGGRTARRLVATGQLDIHRFAEADHTFSRAAERQALFDALTLQPQAEAGTPEPQPTPALA